MKSLHIFAFLGAIVPTLALAQDEWKWENQPPQPAAQQSKPSTGHDCTPPTKTNTTSDGNYTDPDYFKYKHNPDPTEEDGCRRTAKTTKQWKEVYTYSVPSNSDYQSTDAYSVTYDVGNDDYAVVVRKMPYGKENACRTGWKMVHKSGFAKFASSQGLNEEELQKQFVVTSISVRPK